MATSEERAQRVRASENRYLLQLRQRLIEGDTLDAHEQKLVIDWLIDARGLAEFAEAAA